jgi:hypothetical protein
MTKKSGPVSLHLVLIIIVAWTSCTEDATAAAHDCDSSGTLFMSLVPGFFIHGAGHLYIGRHTTGVALFLTEITGIGILLSSGINAGLVTAFGVQPSEAEKPVDNLIVLGNILVWGSWIYDIILPQVLLRKNVSVHVLPGSAGGIQMKCRYLFR